MSFTFTLPAKEVIITNDSATNNIQFKFKASETGATLKPTETVTLKNVNLRRIILTDSGSPYRIWVIG